jgi:Domain of unknown function (DUF6321)
MKTFKQIREECWKGYKQVGGKMKNGRMIPNCVPVKEGITNEKKKLTPEKRAAKAPDAAIVKSPFEKVKELIKKIRSEEIKQLDERGKKPIESRDQMVGVAKVLTKDVTEGYHTSTIAAIAAHAYTPKVGDKIRTRMGGQIPGEVTKVTDKHVYFTHPEGKKYKTHISNVRLDEEVEQLDERGADSKGYFRPTEKGAGLTRKGAKHFGIHTAVTTEPSKLKHGSKAWKRRKSFCARMSGMKGPMKDAKGRPTRKAMSLRRWHCEE